MTYSRPTWEVRQGDALTLLSSMPSGSVACCVTSPPYWGLRDYGVEGQIGLEPTPAEYVARMVEVFREVRRVLSDDGTLWLNLGDCYAGSGRGGYAGSASTLQGSTDGQDQSRVARGSQLSAGFHEPARQAGAVARAWVPPPVGLKNKDLCMIPARAAIALQADGWWVRSCVIWAKGISFLPDYSGAVMPESVQDRPTTAHEYLYLLSKSETYHYDAEAVREQDLRTDHPRNVVGPLDTSNGHMAAHRGLRTSEGRQGGGRNLRSVWAIGLEPFPGAHFAVMPTRLVEPCVRAGCPQGGTVLDPFAGSGTVGVVALQEGCGFLGLELNPEYVEIARTRLKDTTPSLFAAASIIARVEGISIEDAKRGMVTLAAPAPARERGER